MAQKKIKFPRLKLPQWRFKNIQKRGHQLSASLKKAKPAIWLDSIVTILLKTGTLFLVILLIIFIIRIFKSEGYIIESFSVPEFLEKSGYDGFVIARKIQDEFYNIKNFAQSVKKDSVQLIGDEQPELDLKVLGVGVSLRTLVYQVRSLLAQKNQIIQGEVTVVDDQYTLTLRMTGFPPAQHIEKIVDNNHQAAINKVIIKAGEIILSNTDPYRSAILCYQQKRYDEAVNFVRKIIKERPQEIHWAYLAWGSILEEQNQHFAAAAKFKRATELKPDFSLAHVRLGWNLLNQKESDFGESAMRKAVFYDSTNIERWLNLGWLLHAKKMYAAADSAFEKATVIEPEEIDIWSSWADSKISRGKPKEAIKLVQKAEQFAKEDAMGYLTRALGSLARGDSLKAFEHVMTALDFEPSNEIAILAGINTLWEQRDYKRVITVFENADVEDMDNYQRQRVLNIIAMSYNYDSQKDKALETIQKAIDVDPRRGYPYSTLAEIYALSSDLEKFYKYLEISFEKGLSPNQLDFKLEPYLSLKEDRKLKALMDKYASKLKD